MKTMQRMIFKPYSLPFDWLRANGVRDGGFDIAQDRPFDKLRTGLERFKVISRR